MNILATNKIIKICLLCFLFIYCSCSNSDNNNIPNLPSITQIGANTFGCKIDGEILVPKDGIGISMSKGLKAGILTNYSFYIKGRNLRDDDGDFIYIYVYNVSSTGTYTFKQSTGQEWVHSMPDYSHAFVKIDDESDNDDKVCHSFENSGSLIITRYDNNIISGTFDFQVQNINDPNDIIEIAEGRFDLNLSTLDETEFPNY